MVGVVSIRLTFEKCDTQTIIIAGRTEIACTTNGSLGRKGERSGAWAEFIGFWVNAWKLDWPRPKSALSPVRSLPPEAVGAGACRYLFRCHENPITLVYQIRHGGFGGDLNEKVSSTTRLVSGFAIIIITIITILLLLLHPPENGDISLRRADGIRDYMKKVYYYYSRSFVTREGFLRIPRSTWLARKQILESSLSPSYAETGNWLAKEDLTE